MKTMLDLSEKGVYLLCNSLNAYSGAARLRNEPKAADMLLRAQGTIALPVPTSTDV